MRQLKVEVRIKNPNDVHRPAHFDYKIIVYLLYVYYALCKEKKDLYRL